MTTLRYIVGKQLEKERKLKDLPGILSQFRSIEFCYICCLESSYRTLQKSRWPVSMQENIRENPNLQDSSSPKPKVNLGGSSEVPADPKIETANEGIPSASQDLAVENSEQPGNSNRSVSRTLERSLSFSRLARSGSQISLSSVQGLNQGTFKIQRSNSRLGSLRRMSSSKSISDFTRRFSNEWVQNAYRRLWVRSCLGKS